MSIKKKAVMLALFLGVFLACTALGLETVRADVVVEGNSNLVLKSKQFKSKSVIKIPDREAQRKKAEQERMKREAEKRASRGQAYAGKYSDSTTYSGSGSNIVNYAKKFLGKPYVWGAEGPNAFDCSGFTLYVYRKFGVNLPHYTGYQVKKGKAVAKSDLRLGDLIFFNTYENFGHVGIYIGNNKFIHASTGSKKVTISTLSGYYAQKYAGARRIFD